MTHKCAFCEKPEYMPKWFGCPSTTYRPNQYSVCQEHQHLLLTFNDVYPDPYGPPVIHHEYKVSGDAND